MLAKFDPVVSQHVINITQSQPAKSHIPHYLGHAFQNEIISVLASGIK
jgi:hypothetical protein